jgi:FtsP/CotA-like multicopper oxidase with cupredoxin domain
MEAAMDVPRPGTNRRDFLKATGLGVLGTVVVGGLGGTLGRGLGSASAATTTLAFAATDGYITVPGRQHAGHPELDPLYIFGYIPVSPTASVSDLIATYQGHSQTSAPHLDLKQEDDIRITLTNLGLVQRPDLTDSHTIHWHGFDVPSPLNDGVPEVSVAVPIAKQLTYFYRPHDAGTYMYHCHFEDVEHVQMGMTGMVFIRPKQNRVAVAGNPAGTKYAYNDGDGSTRYDREFAFMITELWSAAHYRDAHIQVSDWTDFDPSFWLLNGRGYPDTVAANGNPNVTDAGRLQYQPISSLVRCNTGDRVLLRMSNLGYQNHALSVDNIDLQIVAKDASLLKGRDGTPNYITTNTVDVGPGESRDVIFVAPGPGEYLLYDRKYSYLENGGGPGYGGMMTKILVGAAGTYPSQTVANA